MKAHPGIGLLVLSLLFAGAVALLVNWKTAPTREPRSEPPTTSPPQTPPASVEVVATVLKAERPPTNVTQQNSLPRLKMRAPDLSAKEKAEFEKKFTEKIKPAVEAWCKIYAGHIPFRLEDLTPDKLKERFGDNPSFYDYGFVINGTTLSVVEYHGEFFVAYLTSPAAKQLLELPKNPEPPKAASVTREEVLRLLKADSGQDFPSTQIAMRPTASAGAMNGGVSVDVGEGVNADYAPLFKYSMVFGPDGNLACYLRKIAP